jgi:hypothetical protein
MSPMSLVWIMVCCFGVAAAVGAFEGGPADLPTPDSEWRVLRRRAARSVRGATFMTLGLAMLLTGTPEIAALLWVAFVILSYVAIATRRRGVRGLHEWAEIAAYLTLCAGVLAFIEGMMRDGRSGLFLCVTSTVLAAAARVDFVVDRAIDELAFNS